MARRRADRPAAAPRHRRSAGTMLDHAATATGPDRSRSWSRPSSRSGCSPTRRKYVGPIAARPPSIGDLTPVVGFAAGRRCSTRCCSGRWLAPVAARRRPSMQRPSHDAGTMPSDIARRSWLAVAVEEARLGPRRGRHPDRRRAVRRRRHRARPRPQPPGAGRRPVDARRDARRSATPAGSAATAAPPWSPRCRRAGTAPAWCASSASPGSSSARRPRSSAATTGWPRTASRSSVLDDPELHRR